MDFGNSTIKFEMVEWISEWYNKIRNGGMDFRTVEKNSEWWNVVRNGGLELGMMFRMMGQCAEQWKSLSKRCSEWWTGVLYCWKLLGSELWNTLQNGMWNEGMAFGMIKRCYDLGISQLWHALFILLSLSQHWTLVRGWRIFQLTCKQTKPESIKMGKQEDERLPGKEVSHCYTRHCIWKKKEKKWCDLSLNNDEHNED